MSLLGKALAQGFILETCIISRGSVLIFPAYQMSDSSKPSGSQPGKEMEVSFFSVCLPLLFAGELNVLTLEVLREAGAGSNAILPRQSWQLGTTFPQLALCRGNSMTETRQLAGGSLKFEAVAAAAAAAMPRRVTQDPVAMETDANLHFVPVDLLGGQWLWILGERFLFQ